MIEEIRNFLLASGYEEFNNDFSFFPKWYFRKKVDSVVFFVKVGVSCGDYAVINIVQTVNIGHVTITFEVSHEVLLKSLSSLESKLLELYQSSQELKNG